MERHFTINKNISPNVTVKSIADKVTTPCFDESNDFSDLSCDEIQNYETENSLIQQIPEQTIKNETISHISKSDYLLQPINDTIKVYASSSKRIPPPKQTTANQVLLCCTICLESTDEFLDLKSYEATECEAPYILHKYLCICFEVNTDMYT